MAFIIVEGLPGGGKSYFGAELALQALREGAIVHSNMPIYDGTIEHEGAFPNKVQELGFEGKFKRIPSNPRAWVKRETVGKDEAGEDEFRYSSEWIIGGREGAENVVICDEAALKMRVNSQAQDKTKNEPIEDLVRLARHAGLEVYFLTQDNSQVVAKLRPMADFRILCTNVSKLPLVGPIAAKLYGTFRRTHFRRMERDVYAVHYARFSEDVGTFYKTDAMRAVLQVGGEATRKKGTSALTRSLALKYGSLFLVCILFVLGGMYFLSDTVGEITGGDSKPAQTIETRHEVTSTGEVRTIKEEARPARPKGGLVELEWDAYDEHILAAVVSSKSAVRVRTRGGRCLGVGERYEGQEIVSQFTSGDWWYFVTQYDRLVVVRPILPEERATLPPVTITGKPPAQKLDTNSPLEGIRDMIPAL